MDWFGGTDNTCAGPLLAHFDGMLVYASWGSCGTGPTLTQWTVTVYLVVLSEIIITGPGDPQQGCWNDLGSILNVFSNDACAGTATTCLQLDSMPNNLFDPIFGHGDSTPVVGGGTASVIPNGCSIRQQNLGGVQIFNANRL